MSWTISRYRSGDVVEVRSKGEILATLDSSGCLDRLPFMPEMLQYCGQSFRVRAVAHKTCETAQHTNQLRRIDATVHLVGLSCDGSAHGGCQAACSLFWKDSWLRPASEPAGVDGARQREGEGCTEARLRDLTEIPSDSEQDPTYFCQATQLFDASEQIEWWNLRQYILDVTTGNRPFGSVLSVLLLAVVRNTEYYVQNIRFIRGICWRFSEWLHRMLTGRGVPRLFHKVQPCSRTPSGRLDLRPGEIVRVKSQADIETTLDKRGNNRGLSFDAREMAPFCGGIFRVRSCVTRIVDESTGKMRTMKEPCIMLEGVVCNAMYSTCRLNCPRAIPCYWRELWLERIEGESAHSNGEGEKTDLVAEGAR